jgi:hypothetical protein
LSLELVKEAAPRWFSISSITETEFSGAASIELEGGVGEIAVQLRIKESLGQISVQEVIPGTRYPRTCHERHLQSDEHFCVGIDAGIGISTRDHAVVWWGLLERFLRLQRVAERTRQWPAQQEISHGRAGPHQVAAMAAARKLGIEDQYMRMLEGEKPWFSSRWPKIDPQGRMRNGRVRCPAGCSHKGKPILRRDCCRHEQVAALLSHERLRRQKMEEFHAMCLAMGERCCGTMLKCALRDAESAHEEGRTAS